MNKNWRNIKDLLPGGLEPALKRLDLRIQGSCSGRWRGDRRLEGYWLCKDADRGKEPDHDVERHNDADIQCRS